MAGIGAVVASTGALARVTRYGTSPMAATAITSSQPRMRDEGSMCWSMVSRLLRFSNVGEAPARPAWRGRLTPSRSSRRP